MATSANSSTGKARHRGEARLLQETLIEATYCLAMWLTESVHLSTRHYPIGINLEEQTPVLNVAIARGLGDYQNR